VRWPPASSVRKWSEVSWLVSELEDCCGTVVVSSRSLVVEEGAFREPRGRGTSAVGSRYQLTANGDSNRLRTLKCLINPIINPNPVYNYTHTRDNILHVFANKVKIYNLNLCWSSSSRNHAYMAAP
jgi:hypothetical protein